MKPRDQRQQRRAGLLAHLENLDTFICKALGEVQWARAITNSEPMPFSSDGDEIINTRAALEGFRDELVTLRNRRAQLAVNIDSILDTTKLEVPK